MARQCFFSFKFKDDARRASQVRQMGVFEGNTPAKDNDWEQIKRGGDPAIKRWIQKQLEGRTCTIVLVGQNTARQKWINYEISESWKRNIGVFGVYIHGLRDPLTGTCAKGENPFSSLNFNGESFDKVVTCYNPQGNDSKAVYVDIHQSLPRLVEDAIVIRKRY